MVAGLGVVAVLAAATIAIVVTRDGGTPPVAASDVDRTAEVAEEPDAAPVEAVDPSPDPGTVEPDAPPAPDPFDDPPPVADEPDGASAPDLEGEQPSWQTTEGPAARTPDESVASATFDDYLWHLDRAAIDDAYTLVSPSLRQVSGWDYESFARFWRDDVVGAQLLSIDDYRAADGVGVLDATVAYDLPNGEVSTEQVRASFVTSGGTTLLDGYEVVRARRS